MDTIRIGAGTSDDRMVPALEPAERGSLDCLVFERLAERAVARENLAPQRIRAKDTRRRCPTLQGRTLCEPAMPRHTG